MKWHKTVDTGSSYGITTPMNLRALYTYVRENKPSSLRPKDIGAIMGVVNRPRAWSKVNSLLALCGFVRAGHTRVAKHVLCNKPDYPAAEALLRDHETQPGTKGKKRYMTSPKIDDVANWRRRCAQALSHEKPGHVVPLAAGVQVRRLDYREPAWLHWGQAQDLPAQ